MNTNTVDKLMKARAERKEQESKILENMEEFKKALNGVASTPNGKIVLKTLFKACGVHDTKDCLDGVALIESNARRNLYLKFIRPYLNIEFNKEIEN